MINGNLFEILRLPDGIQHVPVNIRRLHDDVSKHIRIVNRRHERNGSAEGIPDHGAAVSDLISRVFFVDKWNELIGDKPLI